MASILFLVNHPEVYVNHRNYFEEKGFEVTMRHIWRYDYQHYDHVLCNRFISGGSFNDIKKAYPHAILIEECPSIRKAVLRELPIKGKPKEKVKKESLFNMSKYFIDLSHTDIIRSIDIIGIKIKNILLYGETGTGKEHIARYIHFIKKTSGNFIPVDCGSLNDELIASEFYGHIKGAFTGAHQDKEGYFE
jgi:transcriptional regulator of acetoin/glycerol metabolism